VAEVHFKIDAKISIPNLAVEYARRLLLAEKLKEIHW